MFKLKLICLIMVLFSFGAVACGEHDHDHENNHDHNNHDHNNGESAEEEGCEHMKEGPSKTITASLASEAMPVDASTEHTRYDVTLVAGDMQNGGVVRIVVDSAGDHYLFLNKDVPVSMTRVGGDVVAPEKSEGAVAECSSDILKHYVFELEVGTYDLTFGPAGDTDIRFVFE